MVTIKYITIKKTCKLVPAGFFIGYGSFTTVLPDRRQE